MDNKILVDFEKLEEDGLVPITIGGKSGWKDENGNEVGKFYLVHRIINNPEIEEENAYFETLVMIPNELKTNTRMAMSTRNTKSPDGDKTALDDGQDLTVLSANYKFMEQFYPHNASAFEEMYNKQLENQNEILIYPLIVQKQNGPYYQQLTADALSSKLPGFRRIDKQILIVADKIREVMNKQGIAIPQEMDLLGQSAAGTFAQRFSILHLDRTNSLCTNGAKDAIPLPVSSIIVNGETISLPYPLGIGDIAEMTGEEFVFDVNKYRKTPMLMTYGVREDERYFVDKRDGKSIISNYDKAGLGGSITSLEESEILEKIGHTQAERMLFTQKVYENIGAIYAALGFIDYGHGQGKDTFGAARAFIDFANDESIPMQEKMQRFVAVARDKRVINLHDVIHDQELTSEYIKALEAAGAIRHKKYNIDSYVR